MKKEECPKLITFNRFNIIFTIVSFAAGFSFWGKLNDMQKVLYIIVPIVIIFLLVNIIVYWRSVKNFYKKYEELHKNNISITDLYNENRRELEKMEYNNSVIVDVLGQALKLLYMYNDCSEDEKKSIKSALINDFINKLGGKCNENGKGI